MRCALTVLACAVGAPIVVAICVAIFVAPVFFAEIVLGINPLWGGLFWIVAIGAFVGVVICDEMKSAN